MEKDSYPRFLKSNIYLNLLNDLQANSLKWRVLVAGNYRWRVTSSAGGEFPDGSLGKCLGLPGGPDRPRERTKDSQRISTEVAQARGWRNCRWKFGDGGRKEKPGHWCKIQCACELEKPADWGGLGAQTLHRGLGLSKTSYRLRSPLTFMLHSITQRLSWAAEISFNLDDYLTSIFFSKLPLLLLTQSVLGVVLFVWVLWVEKDEEKNNVFN